MRPLRASVFIPFLSTSCWYYLLGSYLEVSCTYKAQWQAYLLRAVVLIQEEQRETNQKTCEVRVMPTNVASRSAADI